MKNPIPGNESPRRSFEQRLRDLSNNLEPRRMRYYSLFVLLLIPMVIAESRVTWIAAERLVLPLVYESAEQVYLADNKGLLSNGDQMVGWKMFVVFSAASISWMMLMAGSTLILASVWPKKPPMKSPR